MLSVLKQSAKDFLEDEAPVRAAALSYYTVFAFPPLLVLLILVAGLVWDPSDVQRALESQFASIIGAEGARTIHGMIASADRPGGGNLFKTLLSIAGLIFGATGAMIQLQGALNRAWDVQPDPNAGGLRNFLTKRVLSLGMILGLGFVVAVSLALSALVSMAGENLGTQFPAGVLQVLNFALSFVVLAGLFAAIYKVLPDAEVAWKDVVIGAVVTAALFVAGKHAIGLYLGRSSPGEAFGAAGALAVILIWVYYAGLILLFGAEFTQAWARSRGRTIEPEPGAIRVLEGKPLPVAARPADTRHELTLSRGSHAMQGNGNNAHPLARTDAGPNRIIAGNGVDGQSVGELFKQLGADTSHLFRQEINLAKAELRESTTHMVKGATKIGMGAAIAIPGLMAFGAFLIIALGDLIDNYWVSALIVSVALLAVAGIMAKRGIAEFGKGSLVPEETVGTLREDAQWAKEESQAFKRSFTAPHSRTH